MRSRAFFDELADEDGGVDAAFMASSRAGSSNRNTSSPRTPAARNARVRSLSRAAAPASASGTDSATGTTSTTRRTRSHALRVPRAHRSHGPSDSRPLKYSPRSKCSRGRRIFAAAGENGSDPFRPDAPLLTRRPPSGSPRPRTRAAERRTPRAVIPSSPAQDRAGPSAPPRRAPCR